MIQFIMNIDDNNVRVQFPLAQRPDDREEFMVSDLNYQTFLNVVIRGRSDERGMMMEDNIGTPVGVYIALRKEGVQVSGGDNWDIRPGIE